MTDPTPDTSKPTRLRPRHVARRDTPPWLNGVFAAISLYLFLSAINVMGGGLKTLGHNTDWLQNILQHADNPFIALLGAVLVTAIVQSSSFTTALIITLVASGQMQVVTAVYAVMGANIGTSVTNTIASIGTMHIRRQFRRAFTAAIVHDVFNWLTVLLIFPTEWIISTMRDGRGGPLAMLSETISGLMGLTEVSKPNSPIKMLTKPVVHAGEWLVARISDDPVTQGVLMAIVGLLLLFGGLTFLVKNLRGALLTRIEGLFSRVFFRTDGTAYTVGALTTIFVQSSSITTSLIVPLAGAGAVKLNRVFPYTLGANLGTTLTGVIAATANPVAGAVTVAIAHVSFNLIGTAIWYPLRRVPIGIARWYGRLAAKRRVYALLFLFTAFFLLPGLGLLITELLT